MEPGLYGKTYFRNSSWPRLNPQIFRKRCITTVDSPRIPRGIPFSHAWALRSPPTLEWWVSIHLWLLTFLHSNDKIRRRTTMKKYSTKMMKWKDRERVTYLSWEWQKIMFQNSHRRSSVKWAISNAATSHPAWFTTWTCMAQISGENR